MRRRARSSATVERRQSPRLTRRQLRQSQQRLKAHDLPWNTLSRERVGTLLSWAYVLRCVDEALEAEPVLEGAHTS